MTQKIIMAPKADEAEMAVLGAVFLDNNLIYPIKANLAESDFFSSRHRLIFRAVSEMAGKNIPIDLISVTEQLRTDGQLERVGGMEYLQTLEEALPTTQALNHHIKTVVDKAMRRETVRVCENYIDAGLTGGESTEEIISGIQETLSNAANRLHGGLGVKHLYGPKECADIAFRKAAENMENPQDIRGIETGLERLDLALRGLKDLNIVSASTGMGKTALCLNLAVNIGIHQGISTLYLNYEMNLEEILYRIQSIVSGVPIRDIFSGKYHGENDYQKIVKASESIQGGALAITGNQPKNINTTVALIQKEFSQRGIKAVFVDYLGEIEPDAQAERENSEYRTFGRWAQTLKNVCTRLGIKLVLAAQLNRDGEDDPRLSKVGGSWKIAQKADTFLIIKKEKQNLSLWIAKNRNGKEKFGIEIDFQKETQRIKETNFPHTQTENHSRQRP